MSAEYICVAMYANLPTEEKFVLVVLGDNAEPEHGVVYPRYDRVSLITGIPTDRVMDIIRGFISRGILKPCADPDALRIDMSMCPKMEG